MDLSCRPRSGDTHASQLINKLSPLETLPTELIHKIFLECLEINLPRASLPIAAALSNETIYTWLIRLAFSSDNDGSRKGFFTHAFLPLDFYSLNSVQRANLQTTILECRWCTLPLMRKCQIQYLEHAIKHSCNNLTFSPEDRAKLDNLEATRDGIRNLDQGVEGYKGKADLTITATKPDNPVPPGPPSTTTSTTTSKKTNAIVEIWFNFGTLLIRSPAPLHYENDSFRLPSCSLTEPCRIPDKLLTAPWTPEKLEFLSLLSTKAYIDEDSTFSRSKMVLRQVIKDREHEAFEKLLKMYIRIKVYRYPMKWPTKVNHFRAALRWADAENDPFVETLLVSRWQDLPKEQVSLRSKMVKHVRKVEFLESMRWAGGLS
ncbi:hypothetical protein FQN54_008686 [Arachnomyces sp. PD_36]|nr:hypothetical protein FQN54_008686 [Arachnomyces sp. PD_36]